MSCSSSTDLGDSATSAFTTDAAEYVAHRLPGGLPRYQFRVITRFENRETSTLYLGRCFPRSTEPLFSIQGENGAAGFGQVWACVGHDQQFAIQPGQVRIDTLVVEGPNEFQSGTNIPIHPVVSGDFRVFFDVRLAPGDGAPSAPDGLKLSKAFRVRTSETLQ